MRQSGRNRVVHQGPNQRHSSATERGLHARAPAAATTADCRCGQRGAVGRRPGRHAANGLPPVRHAVDRSIVLDTELVEFAVRREECGVESSRQPAVRSSAPPELPPQFLRTVAHQQLRVAHLELLGVHEQLHQSSLALPDPSASLQVHGGRLDASWPAVATPTNAASAAASAFAASAGGSAAGLPRMFFAFVCSH